MWVRKSGRSEIASRRSKLTLKRDANLGARFIGHCWHFAVMQSPLCATRLDLGFLRRIDGITMLRCREA